MLEQICDSVSYTYILHFFFTIFMVSLYGENFKNSYSKTSHKYNNFWFIQFFSVKERGVWEEKPCANMAKVHVQNVVVLDNPSNFSNPFQFEITFECLEDLQEVYCHFLYVHIILNCNTNTSIFNHKDLEWKII